MIREDPLYAEKAARMASLARDVAEIIEGLGLKAPAPPIAPDRLRVAYHSACSMQHGQGIHAGPKALLDAAGFEAIEVPEGHLCCGSAGTYNILQTSIAEGLRDRKLNNIARIQPDMVATGQIGSVSKLTACCE